METKFTCTTVETQRDFLEVAYKISFLKNAMWVIAEIAGGIGCIVAAAKGVGNYLLPCGIDIIFSHIWSIVCCLISLPQTGHISSITHPSKVIIPYFSPFVKHLYSFANHVVHFDAVPCPFRGFSRRAGS